MVVEVGFPYSQITDGQIRDRDGAA